MIRLKKMLALAIAMIMVICTVNLAAFADPNSGDLTPDQKRLYLAQLRALQDAQDKE